MVWTAWEHTPRESDEIFGRLEAERLRTFPIISGGDTYLKAAFTTAWGPTARWSSTRWRLAEYMQRMRWAIDETRNPGRKYSAGGVGGAGWKDLGKFGVYYPEDTVDAYTGGLSRRP